MAMLTPLTRRIIALGLLVLLTLALVSFVILPLIQTNQDALDELANVREALARAQAIRDAPEPPKIANFPMHLGLVAPTRKAAGDTVAGYVTSSAATKGLQLTAITAQDARGRPPVPITFDISVTGPRDALLEWMSAMEIGHPALKFRSYQLIDAGQASTPGAMMSIMPTPPVPQSLGTGAEPSGPPPGVPSAPAPVPERRLRLDARLSTLWIGEQ